MNTHKECWCTMHSGDGEWHATLRLHEKVTTPCVDSAMALFNSYTQRSDCVRFVVGNTIYYHTPWGILTTKWRVPDVSY